MVACVPFDRIKVLPFGRSDDGEDVIGEPLVCVTCVLFSNIGNVVFERLTDGEP